MKIRFLQKRRTRKQRILQSIKGASKNLRQNRNKFSDILGRKKAGLSIKQISTALRSNKDLILNKKLYKTVISGKLYKTALKVTSRWYKKQKPALIKYTDNKIKSLKLYYKVNKKASKIFFNKNVPLVQKYLAGKVKGAENTILVIYPKLKFIALNSLKDAKMMGENGRRKFAKMVA